MKDEFGVPIRPIPPPGDLASALKYLISHDPKFIVDLVLLLMFFEKASDFEKMQLFQEMDAYVQAQKRLDRLPPNHLNQDPNI